MRRSRIAGLIASLVLASSLLLCGVHAAGWEIDAAGIVGHVVDGDTVDVDTVGRVRLADINAPELGHPGAQEAADYLASLVINETVYLDVDDVFGTDIYGRTVAVVYVRHNATTLHNVNKALVDAGLAVLDDFPNEFDPATWALYLFAPVTTPPPASGSGMVVSLSVAAALVGVGALAVAYILLRRRGP